MTTESIWLRLDDDMVGPLDDYARSRGIDRHEASRVLLRIALEVVARPRQQPLPGVSR